MAMHDIFKEYIFSILKEEFRLEPEECGFKIERPPAGQWGDYGTNAGFVAAKKLRKNPAETAAKISGALSSRRFIKEARFLPPGYTNWEVENEFYKDELYRFSSDGAYMMNDKGRGKKINVEFVSANPVGPLNVVSGRAAAYGDTLCRLLEKCGYEVLRENYVNDYGRQMKIFGLSLKARYFEMHGMKSSFPEDGYMGEYVKEIASQVDRDRPGTLEEIKAAAGSNREQDIDALFREYGLTYAGNWQANTLENFGVKFDNWFFESSLYEKDKKDGKSAVEKVINKLEAGSLLYEKDGALWFKTSEFGDDKDRVIRKSTGEFTYFAGDIAYVEIKFGRGADMIVNILGPDHHGYVKRLESIVLALGNEKEKLKVIILQQVNLLEDGEKKKMSKREGRIVKLDDLISEVGADAARYFFIMRNYNSHLDFDIALAKEKSDKNPVYYIQYAYARICNIFEHAKDRYRFIEDYDLSEIDFSFIEKEEKDLIRMMLELPSDIIESADKFSPSFFVKKVYGLVSVFHSFYSRHRIVTDDKTVTLKRLFILNGLKKALKESFKIIGITARESM